MGNNLLGFWFDMNGNIITLYINGLIERDRYLEERQNDED